MDTLNYEVRHPFNGGTDYDVLGRFPTKPAAEAYAALMAFKYTHMYDTAGSTYTRPVVVNVVQDDLDRVGVLIATQRRLEELEQAEDRMHAGGPAMTKAEIEELEALR